MRNYYGVWLILCVITATQITSEAIEHRTSRRSSDTKSLPSRDNSEPSRRHNTTKSTEDTDETNQSYEDSLVLRFRGNVVPERPDNGPLPRLRGGTLMGLALLTSLCPVPLELRVVLGVMAATEYLISIYYRHRIRQDQEADRKEYKELRNRVMQYEADQWRELQKKLRETE